MPFNRLLLPKKPVNLLFCTTLSVYPRCQLKFSRVDDVNVFLIWLELEFCLTKDVFLHVKLTMTPVKNAVKCVIVFYWVQISS